MILGMTVSRVFPGLVEKVRKPFTAISFLVFVGVVALALKANWSHFINYVGLVVLAVFVHNALALSTGYWFARAARLDMRDARAVSIEVGIQNSALGLILIFNFFDGLGGMAIVAAWWGIWHIISGLSVAAYWSRRPLPEAAPGNRG
jgi:BASS family bile acid:Na+ symporter